MPQAKWSAKLTINSQQPMLTKEFMDDVTGGATCQLISSGSALAGAIAVGSVYTGQVWGAVGGTAGVIAMQALGRGIGCAAGQDENDPDWQPKPDTCWKSSEGGYLQYLQPSGNWFTLDSRIKCVQINSVDPVTFSTGAEGWRVDWIRIDGKNGGDIITDHDHSKQPIVRINGACDEDGNHPNREPGSPIGKPYVYTDEETGCTWTTTIVDTYIAKDGLPQFHFKAVSNDPVTCGGPYEWWGNDSGPNIPVGPSPGTDDDPEPIGRPPGLPVPPVEPDPPEGGGSETPILPGTTYKLTGVCESVPDGQAQPEAEFDAVGGKYYEALASRVDALAEMLQQHLAYRTPTCKPKPVEGDWRTISFISDETSPNGKSRLRKRFRYRSQSGIELGGLVDHWADFTFTAGPVIVWHSGSTLGTPKVWAASIDEGKRVIRHAFGEAGVDPDQVGEWAVSGSNNPRYGVSGTMRVNTTGGYHWITCRDGADNRPNVEQTRPDI